MKYFQCFQKSPFAPYGVCCGIKHRSLRTALHCSHYWNRVMEKHPSLEGIGEMSIWSTRKGMWEGWVLERLYTRHYKIVQPKWAMKPEDIENRIKQS